jgi:hypothetical protein
LVSSPSKVAVILSPTAAVVLLNLKEAEGFLAQAAKNTIIAVAAQSIKKFFFIIFFLVYLLVRPFGFRLKVGLQNHLFYYDRCNKEKYNTDQSQL